MDLPYSEACERNKQPILAVLARVLVDSRKLLEIGSGTGQHAVHFARHLPHLQWQPTDVAGQLKNLALRVAREGSANIATPRELDVTLEWPAMTVDAVFTANTLHIMSWPAVVATFAGIGEVLATGGLLCVYGPFRYGGAFTTPSNAQFDAGLRARDPASGIRDFEAVDALARAQGLALVEDQAMPANNQLVCWRRGA